MIDTELASV